MLGIESLSGTSAASAPPWEAAYVDVTATPNFEFENQPEQHRAVLAFIVSDPGSVCVPSWGAGYTMDSAASQLDLDRRIARLKQVGGSVVISFGGLLNDELAVRCVNATRLFEAYASVVNRYEIGTIDLDIEGAALTDASAGQRRAVAIAGLQKARIAAGRDLKVWLTLPASPTGLTQAGTAAVAQLLGAGIDLAGVNAMTMDYGASKPESLSMGDASIQTLLAVHAQLGMLFHNAGVDLSDPDVWKRMGATPMIGVNDERGEVFTLEDASTLNRFAQDRGIARMSMWSANRDRTCRESAAAPTVVSSFCSGVEQSGATFASVLGAGFDGQPQVATATAAATLQHSGAATLSAPAAHDAAAHDAAAHDAAAHDPAAHDPVADDPATSPYSVWSAAVAYPIGAKVVWHRNVYVAQSSTMGDVPDASLVGKTASAWTLLGPVLPGEHPSPTPATQQDR